MRCRTLLCFWLNIYLALKCVTPENRRECFRCFKIRNWQFCDRFSTQFYLTAEQMFIKFMVPVWRSVIVSKKLDRLKYLLVVNGKSTALLVVDLLVPQHPLQLPHQPRRLRLLQQQRHQQPQQNFSQKSQQNADQNFICTDRAIPWYCTVAWKPACLHGKRLSKMNRWTKISPPMTNMKIKI